MFTASSLRKTIESRYLDSDAFLNSQDLLAFYPTSSSSAKKIASYVNRNYLKEF